MSEFPKKPLYLTPAVLDKVIKAKVPPEAADKLLSLEWKLSPGESLLYGLPIGAQRFLRRVLPNNQSLKKVYETTVYRKKYLMSS
jgi:hypothetical protein